MGYVPNQRPGGPGSFNNWQGRFDVASELPNVPGSPLQQQAPNVQQGDLAWVDADSSLYVCVIPTAGSALWLPVAISSLSLGETLYWGNDNVAATTATRFLAPGWNSGTALTVPRPFRVARSGNASQIRVVHQAPAGNGNPIVYTLRINGVPTNVSVAVPSTASLGQNVTDSVPLIAGDVVDLQVTKSVGIGASPLRVGVSVRFD